MADETTTIILGVVGLVGSLVGGLAVALTNQLFGKEKTRAESKKAEAEAAKATADAKKSEAEAAKARAEESKILSEMKLSGSVAIRDPKKPKGWFLAGSAPYDYEIGIDDQVSNKGTSSGYIKSRDVPRDFGTMMQIINANKYKGKRLKMVGYARSERVRSWAGFWMRVDGPDGSPLGFDNMQDRPIRGSTGWTTYQVVLDVPEDSVQIAYGILLSGEGQVWVDELHFDIVDQNVLTTEPRGMKYPDQPVNLNFEELDVA